MKPSQLWGRRKVTRFRTGIPYFEPVSIFVNLAAITAATHRLEGSGHL